MLGIKKKIDNWTILSFQSNCNRDCIQEILAYGIHTQFVQCTFLYIRSNIVKIQFLLYLCQRIFV